MFAGLIDAIRVKARSKTIVIGIVAGLAVGLGMVPVAAGFVGHAKSNSQQLSAQLSAQPSRADSKGSQASGPTSGQANRVPGGGVQQPQSGPTTGTAPQGTSLLMTNGRAAASLNRKSPSATPHMEGAQKFDLLGPNGLAFCDGSGVFSGTDQDFGTAIINAPGDKTVEATVHLEKQMPNTKYLIRLVQGISDCHTVDATVMTNGQGNATIHFSEPSTSSHALIVVDARVLFGPPSFVTQTYFHS